MSRRPPNPAAERTAQNQQALKALVKLESNKSCADCKKNKHPRWASWNLGIFVCIRCSGIHRGMGTHISRVKSVDLDSWTDEQTQSMLKWGNARANKYWEAKLAPGHVPAEAKIENFIRTKYDSKRWVMDGPMPDPATLQVDEVEAAQPSAASRTSIDRSSSQRVSSATARAARPQVDLFGDEPSAIVRPNTTEPVSSFPPPTPPKSAVSGGAAPAAAARPTKPADSLLGFDFFGGAQAAAPSRQSTSTPPSAAAQSRPDLKQSILSLYAAAPRPTAPTQLQHAPSGSINGQNSTQSGLASLDDAFGSLKFGSTTTQSPPVTQKQASSFSSLTSPTSQSSAAAPSNNFNFSGGNFFDAKPSTTSTQSTTSPPLATTTTASHRRKSSGFGDFETAISPSNPAPPQVSSGNFDNDPSGFSSPPATSPPPVTSPQPPKVDASPFNLSSAAASLSKTAKPAAPAASTTTTSSAAMNMDPWGSNDVWASGNNSSTPAASTTTASSQPAPVSSSSDFGWGDSSSVSQPKSSAPPKITEDEDFGGWSSNVPQTPVTTMNPPKPSGGLGGGDDLFSNVWE